MSNVETLSGLQRRLNAAIPQQQLRGEIETRLKRIGRTAKVAGFRPGKVPFKVLEQQYGASVRQEALGEALYQSFAEVAFANKLQVAGSPQFEVKTNDLNAPQIEYSATFEVYPEVTLGDLTAESVNRASYQLNDADVEETLTSMRKRHAKYERADRAAQNDDQVDIDFTGKLDGAVFEGGEGKGVKVVLGAGRMLADFEKAIIGMKAGDTKDFDLTFPADYHGKEVAGKQVTFTVTVNAVEAPNLPVLDADFAKLLGQADGDVEKLKQQVRENIDREAQRRVKVRNKDSVMDALLKVAQLEVPKALLENETERLQHQASHELESRGMRVPKGMSFPADLFAERATKRVKLGLILSDLVEKHGLSAKPEQVEAMINEYAQSYERPEDVVRWYRSDASRLREIENLVLEDNVVAWVMSQVKTSDRAVTLNELLGGN